MRKTSSIILLLIVLFVFSLTSSFAQESTSPRVEARLKVASEEAQAKREVFREKLITIRDAKKKQIVERVQERIDSINKKRVEQYLEFLDRLTKTLDKIEVRKDKAKANGRDTVAVEAAIRDARAAIATARAAVEAQAGKTYVIEIKTEARLRSSVGKAISTLQKDLRDTHKIVTDSKQVVQKVFSLLQEIKGVDDAD